MNKSLSHSMMQKSKVYILTGRILTISVLKPLCIWKFPQPALLKNLVALLVVDIVPVLVVRIFGELALNEIWRLKEHALPL